MRFSSDISLWWLLPIAILAVVASLWMYSRKSNGWVSDLSKRWRTTFIVLRSFSVFLIAVLLFGIIFQAFNYKKEKPILVIGVDDSSSMHNYADSTQVSQLVEEVLELAKNELRGKFDILPYSFSGIPSLLNQKVRFNAESTDLSQAFEATKSEFYNRNLAGVLLISDGNYNTGSNPIYAAEKYNTASIYTLGAGDTITKRDQLIKHISHNDVAFLKNDFPVVIDIEGIKMGKIGTEVSIESNGKKIASQTIQFKDGVSDYEQVSFLLNATSPGIQQYVVKLTHKDKEYNYENNTRTIYVEVIDSRSKVLLLSAAPHPDISALKSAWDKDQNLEVNFKLLSEWNRDLKNVDLIVWHEPGLDATRDIQQAIMNNSISKLFIVGSQSNASSIHQLNIGVEIPAGKNLDDYEASLNSGFNSFEYSDELKKAFNYYPPLKAKFGNFRTPKDASVLLYQRVGPVVKKDALLFFANGKSESGASYKYGFIYGEGIWKWKLTEYARTQNFVAFDELVSRTGQYLMVKQNTEPFRVTLPKKFTPSENVTINATVLNASLDPVTTSEVHFVLTNEKGKESKLQFGISGTNYKLDLGKLESGKYTWKAYTSINGKYHEKKGEFIVKPLFLEQADNSANHNLLRQLAEKTDGSFHTLKNYRQTIQELKNREDFSSMSYQETSFNELIEYFLIFLLLVLSLFAEWFLRRYLGSY
jgi:hypothetical protein